MQQAPFPSGVNTQVQAITTRQLARYARHRLGEGILSVDERMIDLYEITDDSQWQLEMVAIEKLDIAGSRVYPEFGASLARYDRSKERLIEFENCVRHGEWPAPPLVLLAEQGGLYSVEDGSHRARVALAAGATHVPAYVWRGHLKPELDVSTPSLKDSDSHGSPLDIGSSFRSG